MPELSPDLATPEDPPNTSAQTNLHIAGMSSPIQSALDDIGIVSSTSSTSVAVSAVPPWPSQADLYPLESRLTDAESLSVSLYVTSGSILMTSSLENLVSAEILDDHAGDPTFEVIAAGLHISFSRQETLQASGAPNMSSLTLIQLSSETTTTSPVRSDLETTLASSSNAQPASEGATSLATNNQDLSQGQRETQPM